MVTQGVVHGCKSQSGCGCVVQTAQQGCISAATKGLILQHTRLPWPCDARAAHIFNREGCQAFNEALCLWRTQHRLQQMGMMVKGQWSVACCMLMNLGDRESARTAEPSCAWLC